MSLHPPRHEAFKRRLRQALEEEGLSVYALARRLDPQNPESAERNIFRWLSPESTTIPSLPSRLALARCLGRDPDFFAPNLGAADRDEIESRYASARLHEEAVTRRVWITGADGHFISEPSQRRQGKVA